MMIRITSFHRASLVNILAYLLMITQIDSEDFGGQVYTDTTLALTNSPYVVKKDIFVSENATLNIEPGVKMYILPGIALQINGSLQAKGNATHRIVLTKMSNNSMGNTRTIGNEGIRLADGGSYKVGRLEIFVHGKWGTVCNEWFDEKDAQVACRQLGFMKAKRYYTHGGGKGQIWLSHLQCNGREKSLLNCKRSGSFCFGYDVGVECDNFAWHTFFWSGIMFKNSKISSTLQHLDISDAYKAISGDEYLPELDHVTVTHSAFGVISINLKSPLILIDSAVRNNTYAGVQITGKSKNIQITNTTIGHTIRADGFSYSEIEETVDFCSASEASISFPTTFRAVGQARRNVECSKVFQSVGGNRLVVYFHSTPARSMELYVHDGNSANGTILAHVDSDTVVYKDILPHLSSDSQIYIRFRCLRCYGGILRFTVTDDGDLPSIAITNSTLMHNDGSGAVIKKFTGRIKISKTKLFRNMQHGLAIEGLSGILSVRYTELDSNTAKGLLVVQSSLLVSELNEVLLIRNRKQGLHFYRVSMRCHLSSSRSERNFDSGLLIFESGIKCNITDAIFKENSLDGIRVDSSFGYVNFDSMTAISNKGSGVYMLNGMVSSVFQHSKFCKNERDGCRISNQFGGYKFYNSVASSNLRHGIHLFDGTDRYRPRRHFEDFTLQSSTVSANAKYGVNLNPECMYWYNSAINVTLFISENSITRNLKGGVYLFPAKCLSRRNERQRRIIGTITYNHFEQNRNTSFYLYCTGRFGFNAVFSDNTFFNNTGNAITLTDSSKCGSQFESNPVHVDIRRNYFMKNTAESVIYIDFHSFSQTRSALLKNNTFKQNKPSGYDPFSNIFRRFENRACVILNVGNFALHRNVFENPEFKFEISTIRQDVRNIIHADLNWWGTSNECEIFQRLFAFHRRCHLSPITYFPFFVSYDMTEHNSLNTSRPSCFLKGSTIGGSLDRNLTLSSARSPYTVRDDIIVLTNATLTVRPNVTLQFPAKSTMVVQGRLIASGTVSKMINFVRFQSDRRFRLARGAGPWDGILEILVNSTWWPACGRQYRSYSTEGKIVCKQLGFDYDTVFRTRVPLDVRGFIHNIICNVDGNDIMSCSASAWRYDKKCRGYTIYITCKNYHWGGLHLALTQHRSKLHHVEIRDAGYAYRNDISEPGVSLRIDFNQHDISHIYIHNSKGIGVEATYTNIYRNYNTSIIPMSIISNTASHGFSSMSPWLVLTDLNVTQTEGSAFFISNLWGVANDLADELTSPDMYQIFRVCSSNKTIVSGNNVFYFSLERLRNNQRFSCEHILQTEPGYRIVLQILYNGFTKKWHESDADVNVNLGIFDGVNKSHDSSIHLYKIGSYDQRVFNCYKSSILFDFFKAREKTVVFKFLVYTVKENETFPNNVNNSKIEISRSRISNSDNGVYVAGNVLKSVDIFDTQITNSRDSGIKVSSNGHIRAMRVVILDSKKNGILVVNSLITFFVTNVHIINSDGQGIYTKADIGTVKFVSTLLENLMFGIYVESMDPSTDFLIENCVINATLYHSIVIGRKVQYGKMRILNSTLSHSEQESVYIAGTYNFNLLINGSTFALNKKSVVYYHREHYNKNNRITMVFENNNFVSNQEPVLYMYDCCKMSVIIRGNNFHQNQASSIINLDARSSYSCRPTMLISENIFSANLCPKKAVICLESDVSSVRLEKNIFDFNLGRCLHMAGSVADCFSITRNVFYRNSVKDHSVLDFLRIEENAVFTNNSFIGNKANGVVSLQVVYKTESTFKRRGHVNFTQNVLSHNLPSSSSGRIPGKADSCSVSVSGVLFFKKTDIHFNSFDNPEYTKEFCVLVPATSHRDIIDISNNWWRTENSFEVRDRISDFDDNYDYAIAESWPFLNANKSLALGLRQYYKQRGRILSGRITESTSLKASKSPYRITSDLTILKNTTLVVEAGVTLKLLPGVSILVIGALQVKGTPLQPVHFTIDNPTGRNNRSRMIVRLADGSFPWQGMAQLFNGSVWLPLVTPGNLSASNLTNVICKQLGYGPPTTGKQIGISPFQNVSDFFQLHCLGNETTLDECNNVEKNKSSNMSLVHLECHGTVWGNVRFVSSSEKNLTQPRSSLNFVKFTHCGNRHGMHVPAIETVINIPIMNAITVQNCTAGGLTIAFPNRYVHINQSLFLNTGGTAITVLQTRRKVLVENSMFRENIRGISFEEPRMEKEPQVNYGRVFLCSDVKLIHIQTTKLFYFKLSLLENIPVVQHCEKALTAPDGKGFKLVVLYQSGSRYIQIFDSHSSNDKSIYQGSVASIVQKDFFIPRGEILLRWNGDSNSKITVLIEAIKISDMPCTFELDFCGWQSFTNVSVVGRKMSQTWARNSYTYYLSDHSYFSDHGKLLISRGSYLNSKSLNAGIISPIIESQQFCFFRFFYYLRSESFRSLSGIYIYTITGSYTNFQRRLIWSTRKYRIYQWEKVLLRLPRYADEYRIALVGETTSGYVAIDDLELMLCNVGDHRLSNNIFVGNKQNSIQYTSLAAEKAESRPKFVIERSQVVNTLSSTNSVSKSPIFLEIQDNYFTIANNFIANNIHGGIEAKLGGNFAGTRQKSTDCSIYGNTFVGNTNGAILLVGRGSGIQRIRIKIMKNTFENNLGPFSTFKVNNIQVNIVSNFFFNNSGKRTLEYHFESDGFKDQTCEMNTFYFNRGVGPSHGVTILTNGPVDFRRNNFKNPVNLYELSSRKMSVTDPIKAINNWWGAGKADYVRSRIYGKKKNDEFALVIYEPFKKLPPRDILSIGCPPSWQKIGSTCVVVRRGVQTFKEAVEYCQYHGGRVASWSSAEEKKFIAMALVESRPEEEQHVAIWVMTKQYLENGQISKQKCAVRTYEYKYRAVPCKSLYPYICTQAAVTHCPNGCFHNGDCVGTTCFCYRGWTGRDCSQFHCNEANNCSGNGLCIGPNACKCSVGFLGRGCTYSVCGKFRKCIDCYRDSSCGWCDSSQQCIAGTSIGPHSTKCPDWFYHNCHTVGNVSTCSKNIMRVDCAMRQCNRSEKTTTLESCQKCHDYEKCFKKVEEGVCKSWNDTRCPDGRVHADYSDPKRVENVVYKKNVKIVDPKITKIYNCPIQVAGEEDSSLVLVAPAKLGLKVGDVLLSGQAGGLMHKVSDTTEKGNFTFILGRPAAIKEAISYADFTQEGKAAQFIDETTLDIEPNSEYVNGVIDGSIKLKETKIHVLSKETSFFKCLAGYIYEIGENVLTTYYIVMEKSKVEDVSQGDVFVSVKNSGFIERVVQKTINQNISFLETKIERCTQEFDLTNRFIKARPSSKEDVYCFGGDNNNGIVISELSDGSENKEIEVGDLIMGREGYPVLAKVIGSRISGDYILVEVISVKWISDGIASAGHIDVDQIHEKHRRERRATASYYLKQTFGGDRYLVYRGKKGKIEIEPTITLDATIAVSFTINDQDEDTHISGRLSGSIGINLKAIYSFKENVSSNLLNIVKPRIIPFYISFVPCEVILSLEGEIGITSRGASRTIEVTSQGLSLTFFIKPGFSVEGKCSRSCRTSCSIDYNGTSGQSDKSNTKRSTGSAIEAYAQIVPRVELKVSVVPNFARNLFRKVTKFISRWFKRAPSQNTREFGLSLTLGVSWPLKNAMIAKPCSSKCPEGKTHVTSIWTFSTIKARLTAKVSFKSYSREISLEFAKPKEKSYCIPCDKRICKCASNTSTTEIPTTASISKDGDFSMRERSSNGDSSGKDCETTSCYRYPKCKKPVPPVYGNYPTCVSGRKGLDCSQPDVESCLECQNGWPQCTELGSRCFCFPGWVGMCCDERDRSNNGGDPHLQTLDGIEYDYFGIGEYWACKSIESDFGIQFRFFAYQRASLIGGVSVKAGMSVLTVMTLNYSRHGDLPNLRIDGALTNISSYSGRTVTLNNGTVSLSTQQTLRFDSQEAAVLLISLQFESGVTVTIDVRHSDVMKRQYLNVLYTLGVNFEGKTEGLCGIMDKDTSNDFTGPNGELFPNAILFGNSWEIRGFHSNSGLRGSWSWNSTNFHVDDVMDSSYNDPHYSPLYTLDGINQIILEKAVETCSNRGLSNGLLKSCIYDVSVTNDTSLADQEEMKPECPNQCSGKGRCVNSTCVCMAGWSGKSCEIGNCSICDITNGECVKGFCQCKDGWEGHTCNVKATCYNVGNCTSIKQGVCQKTNLCRCNDGFIGRNCSIIPTCSNVSDCSGKGICVDYDVCKCNREWTGRNCTLHSCSTLDYCSGHGQCVDVDVCVCDSGWTGVSCALADCAEVGNCSGQGECIASNVCRCYPGFSGSNCTNIAECGHLRNCSGTGACTQEKSGENTTCRCYNGFRGLDCSIPSCSSVNNCSDHGKCVEANLCQCDIGYGGANCSIPSCEGVNYCSGHGNCTGYDNCVCDPLWQGSACNLGDCSKVNHCNNQGICVSLDTCLCYPGWEGANCNLIAKVNLHAPTFNETLYNVSLLENSPIGTKVIRVQAKDADTGQKEQMFYILMDNRLKQKPTFEIPKPLFGIDSRSGEIFTSSVFDYESVGPQFFTLNVQVSDNGYPPKTALASVHVVIEDTNDNCPIFKSPSKRLFNLTAKSHPGTLLTEVYATDADSGVNSQVKYTLSTHSGDFKIEELNGSVIVAKELSVREYSLLIVAYDMGLPKCSTEIKINVNVYGNVSTTVTGKPTAIGTKKDIPSALPLPSWYKQPVTIALFSTGCALVFLFVFAFFCRKYFRRRVDERNNQVVDENRTVKAHPMLKLAWSETNEGRCAESEL